MPTYNVSLAQSVRVYGTAEIEATSFEDAIKSLIEALEDQQHPEAQVSAWDLTDVDYSTAHDATIISIEEERHPDITYPDEHEEKSYDDIELQDKYKIFSFAEVMYKLFKRKGCEL